LKQEESDVIITDPNELKTTETNDDTIGLPDMKPIMSVLDLPEILKDDDFEDEHVVDMDTAMGESNTFAAREFCTDLEISETLGEGLQLCDIFQTVKEEEATFVKFDQHDNFDIDDNPSFKCTKCPKTFTSYDKLKTHVQTHTKQQTLKCDKCLKVIL
jgi:hypothetical protein